MTNRVVVVGAGQAGFEVCAQLRALEMSGPIALISGETQLPYQRPPLSKAYLLGEMDLERLFFRPAAFYDDHNIDLHLGTDCLAIDRSTKQVRLGDGSTLEYDQLILATGARSIRLGETSGGDLDDVHYMRDLADADRIAKAVRADAKALVVGGGYIGLETAAVLAGIGMLVVVVEAAARILQRVASVQTSDFFRKLHQVHGVDIREDVMLQKLIATQEHITGAELSDGTKLSVDIVIVGIGVRPNQKLAEDAGLEIENGIKVDAQCRTSDPNIFAAGDCASFPHPDGQMRLESVGNAIDQGQLIAKVIMGQDMTYQPKPWFWSDQYDTKLQIAGLSNGHDIVVTRKTSPTAVSFWYYRQGQLIAVDAMNDPRAYMVGKRLIEGGISPDPEKVRNIEINLKELLG
nr:FAD-dependent oxidoreductase [Octadecabacter arcticus]